MHELKYVETPISNGLTWLSHDTLWFPSFAPPYLDEGKSLDLDPHISTL